MEQSWISEIYNVYTKIYPGVMANVLDCRFEVSEFELAYFHYHYYYHCYFHYQTNTLENGRNPFIIPCQLWVK